jgi:hypothetical protein
MGQVVEISTNSSMFSIYVAYPFLLHPVPPHPDKGVESDWSNIIVGPRDDDERG